MNSSLSIHIVDVAKECEHLFNYAEKIGIIGIDIESDSMYVYQEKLALLQICIENHVYLIDVPKIGLPTKLVELLVNKNITKVFQDMKFDLNIFKKQFGLEIEPVFDISIADKMIRQSSESSNMNKLISKYLGLDIHFSKRQQKSNWAGRPLSEKQINYASKDVVYLVPIHKVLSEQLTSLRTYKSFIAYMRSIKPDDRERYYNPNYVYRVARKFKVTDKSVINRIYNLLWELDKLASNIDKPPHWLLSDGDLVLIAKKNPYELHEFNKIFAKNDKLQPDRDKIAEKLFNSLQNSETDVSEIEPVLSTKRWQYEDNNIARETIRVPEFIFKKVRDWRGVVASKLNLLPEMVLERKDIAYAITLLDKPEAIIDFPALPLSIESLLKNDLRTYLETSQSSISWELISEYNKNKIS